RSEQGAGGPGVAGHPGSPRTNGWEGHTLHYSTSGSARPSTSRLDPIPGLLTSGRAAIPNRALQVPSDTIPLNANLHDGRPPYPDAAGEYRIRGEPCRHGGARGRTARAAAAGARGRRRRGEGEAHRPGEDARPRTG